MACVGAEDASVSVEAGDTSAMMGVEDGDPLGVTEVGEDVAGVVVVDGNGDGGYLTKCALPRRSF